MILGLGLTQLFAGIGNLLQIRHRIKTYWLHELWILILILFHVHMWWSLWALRTSVAWTYPLFLYLLVGPAGLVIASHIIIPGEFYDEVHGDKFDLRGHYYATSHLFFGILAATGVWTLLLEPILGVGSFFVGFRFGQVLATTAILACAASRRTAVHVAALGAVIAHLAVAMLVRFRPGAFDF
jgi:hypothetical protein